MAIKQRILIVDDEPSIVELLRMSMRRYGYQPLVAVTGEEALQIAKQEKPDLVLLDLMLPGIDGLETCRLMRQDVRLRTIPIIMLTAKSEETDKIIGLGIGADDYITKPFSVRELFARVAALLRRAEYAAEQPAESSLFHVRDLDIDPEHYSVRRRDEDLGLTQSEFLLFLSLARSEGQVVSREKLMAEIAGSATTDPRTLDVHISNLRKKLDLPNAESYIKTMRGVGYRV